MALPDQTSNGPGEAAGVADSEAFLEQSYLTYIIPFATNFSPESALQQGAGSVESTISNIEQRDQLFFGTRFAHCSLLLRPHRSCAGRR
jgi:hypothetical protein